METIFKEIFLFLFMFLVTNTNSQLFLPTSPNCASTDSFGNCLNCRNGYFLNNWMCYLGNPYCDSYNVDGSCLDCIQGNLVGNLCLIQTDCILVDAKGKCVSCPVRYQIMGANCFSIASLFPYCAELSGSVCTACVVGAYFSNGSCLVGNPFCAVSDVNGKCLGCSAGLILSSPNCVSNDACLTSDLVTSNCLSCHPGYTVMLGRCSTWNSVSPFCSVFNSDASCSECLLGYYLSSKVCIPVPSLCYTYEKKTGKCKNCYNEYILSGSGCILSSVDNINITNITNVTVKNTTISSNNCSQRFYWNNATGICTQADSSCNDYNLSTGSCVSCNSGFVLLGTTCVQVSVMIPFCLYFLGTTCLSCMNGYYIGNGVCLPVNPECFSYTMIGGSCLSCFQGYYLSGVNCLVMNPLCKTVDSNGNCASCFQGFVVSVNTCVSLVSINPSCATFIGVNCTNCIQGFYIGINGICLAINPLCRTYTITGQCLSCYWGTLSGSICI